jgi:hypothetical protein
MTILFYAIYSFEQSRDVHAIRLWNFILFLFFFFSYLPSSSFLLFPFFFFFFYSFYLFIYLSFIYLFGLWAIWFDLIWFCPLWTIWFILASYLLSYLLAPPTHLVHLTDFTSPAIRDSTGNAPCIQWSYPESDLVLSRRHLKMAKRTMNFENPKATVPEPI